MREDMFGPYQLLERIAAGGMAEIFKAQSFDVQGVGRVFAIKKLPSHLTRGPEFTEMLKAEATRAAYEARVAREKAKKQR